MIVTGQDFTQETFNDAFVSKAVDSTMEGKLSIENESNATGPTDGALHIAGGVSIAKDLYVGGIFASGAITKSSQDNVVAHAGGGQAGAVPLVKEVVRVSTVATAGDSVRLPAATAGLQIFVQNDGLNSLDVFPEVGESIDKLDPDLAYAISVAQKNAIFVCASDGSWRTVSGGGAGGGIISVADNTARDAIDPTVRYRGMMAFVQATNLTWQLRVGITNSDWVTWSKSDVGLSNVDNTSDANKPVSTATQAALNLKADASAVTSALAGKLNTGDEGYHVSAVQIFTGSGVITLLAVPRQRVKIKASSPGYADVTLPNGTIDGQEVIVQGDHADNTCSIANGGNIIQNGDSITFTKYLTVTYCWDADDSVWVQLGGS